ncbi:dephospho-CoA kinase [Cytobacillus spongiae]|jgi:dephospho-CoA kinase|uniref:dephospho-CoA kinase n=1 Tax=Cytobacillus spongiae TaxID=2901381 RepID=UPI001EECD78A|nr:dephospho-CoA kinase [Cytobacillus spongiae]UII55142.1 dephospho-CoA kinase [Cytobacillus spongiae]
MAIVIGLTGGIASGKSTVSAMLHEMGIFIIDADVEAKLAVGVGEQAYHDIVLNFGKDILLENGEIDRGKLGSIIFHDKEKRLELNRIVHPAVRKRMLLKKERAILEGAEIIVMDIPLLFESELTYMVDKVLLVYVDEATQLRRLIDRNHLSKEEAIARIQSQMPLKEKVAQADYVIDNNGTIEETKEQLFKFLNNWS